MLRCRALCFILGLAAVGLLDSRTTWAQTGSDSKQARLFAAENVAFFEKEVLPLLKANCFKCHGGEKTRGGLRLTSRESVLSGGDQGPAISLEKPEESRLLQAINYRDGLEMPPKGKLAQSEIDILTRWVKAGAPWTPGSTNANSTKEAAGKRNDNPKDYWAYKPLERPKLPTVHQAGWASNPIDAFILAKLQAKGLSPTTPADRIALLRRACYDLTGLPPKPEDVVSYLRDQSPQSYERLLDRLLDSPQYGEKWGRHWLDLVHYAETNGYERDGIKPFAWRFRDYVIRSFNQDKPYDHFLREQLAGDELPGNSADPIIATGYYRLCLWDDEPADPKLARYDELDDIVATTAQVVLGMTMNCARCHDHKIDPIPQADYYRFLAFFQDVQHYSDTRNVRSSFNLTDIAPRQERAKYEVELQQREGRLSELTAAMEKIENDAILKMPAEDQRAPEGPDRPQVIARKLRNYLDSAQARTYRQLKRELDTLKNATSPHQQLALSVNHCLVRPPQTHLLIRGNPHVPGAKVEPAFPSVLGHAAPTIPEPGADAKSSGRRSALAAWITSNENQLTARVMANRLWQYHFGRGIVPTPNDFGKFGTPPTHPELLDWLASEFMAGGWKIKRMHKLIMMSSAYQMSSQAADKALALDPANTLFWRFNMRRLTAEEVRDSMLAVSGKLNLKTGGQSVYAPIPKEVLAGQSVPGSGWGKSPPEEAARRSVYIHVKRSLLVPILSIHDQADTDTSCPARYTTTVPTQALGMINGEFTNEQALAFALRLQREAPEDLAAQVRRAMQLTTARSPTSAEVQRDMAFVQKLQNQNKLSATEALSRYCLLALNTNEFIYLD